MELRWKKYFKDLARASWSPSPPPETRAYIISALPLQSVAPTAHNFGEASCPPLMHELLHPNARMFSLQKSITDNLSLVIYTFFSKQNKQQLEIGAK